MSSKIRTQIRRAVVVLAATAIAATALASTASADLEWQPTPTGLSPSDTAGQSPKVAALGDGDAVAIWAESPDCSCPFFGVNAATWDGATNTWSASTPIPDQTGPVLAIPPFAADLAVAGSTNGTAVAVWAGFPDDNGNDDPDDDFIPIEASVYDGSTWGSATTIGSGGFFEGFPNVDVAIDDGGRAVAVWTSVSDTTIEIDAATYDSGTWAAPVPISDPDDEVDYARVAALGGGAAVVIWAGCGCSDPVLQSSTFDGGAWSTPEDVDPAGADDPITPAIAATGSGTATASWIDFDPDTDNDVVRTATYTSAGWANHVSVSDEDDEAASPDITKIGTGAAAVVWVIDPLGGSSVRAESVPHDLFCGCVGIIQGSTSAGGDSWTPPLDLSDSTEADEPDVSGIGDGAAVAVWFTGDIFSSDSQVQAATFDGATANAPRTLTEPGALGIFPQTAGTGAGTAQTVWTGDGGISGLSSNASLGAPEVLKVATPGGTVTIATEPGGFLHMKNLPIPASPTPPLGATFPYGMFSFDIVNVVDGASATVTLTLPAPVTGLWKLQHDAWTELPGTTVAGNELTYTVVDGGVGDADGVANGTIVDPAAPGIRTASTLRPDFAG